MPLVVAAVAVAVGAAAAKDTADMDSDTWTSQFENGRRAAAAAKILLLNWYCKQRQYVWHGRHDACRMNRFFVLGSWDSQVVCVFLRFRHSISSSAEHSSTLLISVQSSGTGVMLTANQ